MRKMRQKLIIKRNMVRIISEIKNPKDYLEQYINVTSFVFQLFVEKSYIALVTFGYFLPNTKTVSLRPHTHTLFQDTNTHTLFPHIGFPYRLHSLSQQTTYTHFLFSLHSLLKDQYTHTFSVGYSFDSSNSSLPHTTNLKKVKVKQNIANEL